MTRLLLNRATSQLIPYPRQDDEPVAGLDRNAAYVVQVVRDAEPEYDPTTHYLQPLEPVVSITDPDSDDVNGTATYDWELVAIVPPPPAPDWARFKAVAMGSDTLNAILATAYQTVPVAAGALAPALMRCEAGGVADFATAWSMCCTAANVPSEVIAGFVGVATACHLPEEFVAALGPLPE
jgi:hypothetical protein